MRLSLRAPHPAVLRVLKRTEEFLSPHAKALRDAWEREYELFGSEEFKVQPRNPSSCAPLAPSDPLPDAPVDSPVEEDAPLSLPVPPDALSEALLALPLWRRSDRYFDGHKDDGKTLDPVYVPPPTLSQLPPGYPVKPLQDLVPSKDGVRIYFEQLRKNERYGIGRILRDLLQAREEDFFGGRSRPAFPFLSPSPGFSGDEGD